jgi:putative oxidoreductase
MAPWSRCPVGISKTIYAPPCAKIPGFSLAPEKRRNLADTQRVRMGARLEEAMPNQTLAAMLNQARARALALLKRFHWLALLFGRAAVGLVFMSTGWGKVHDIPKVTGFFQELHIPAPAFNAVLVAYSELICGTLLVMGLFTRLATVPLIVSMIVAILTAKLGDIHSPFDLFGFDEFTYLCVLFVVAILGPGTLALDHWLAVRVGWAEPD